MRGGGFKEDALKALTDNKQTAEDVLRRLINQQGTTETYGDYTYMGKGSRTYSLLAKKKEANNSTYIEIYSPTDY
jgi:hypothetical protein